MLKRAETAVRVVLESRLVPCGITLGQYTTLSLVRTGSQSSAELARRAGVTPQSMSELISALIRKGLIRRPRRPERGRVLSVNLTERGNALLENCEREVDLVEAALLASLKRGDKESLRSFLRRIVEAADAHYASAPPVAVRSSSSR